MLHKHINNTHTHCMKRVFFLISIVKHCSLNLFFILLCCCSLALLNVAAFLYCKKKRNSLIIKEISSAMLLLWYIIARIHSFHTVGLSGFFLICLLLIYFVLHSHKSFSKVNLFDVSSLLLLC